MKLELNVGDKFGRLTLVEWNKGKGQWFCQCDCGGTTYAYTYCLKNGTHTACKCGKSSVKAMIKPGTRFGKLVVIEHSGDKNKGYICQCDCGEQTHARSDSLKKGRHKSCGCSNRLPRPEKRLPNNQACINEIFKGYSKQAHRRGYKFDLTLDQFENLIFQNCHYCGCIPSTERICGNGRTIIYNGIDRIDNSIGYEINNVVTACKICNNSKNTLTVEEWKDWIQRIHNRMFNDYPVGGEIPHQE